MYSFDDAPFYYTRFGAIPRLLNISTQEYALALLNLSTEGQDALEVYRECYNVLDGSNKLIQELRRLNSLRMEESRDVGVRVSNRMNKCADKVSTLQGKITVEFEENPKEDFCRIFCQKFLSDFRDLVSSGRMDLGNCSNFCLDQINQILNFENDMKFIDVLLDLKNCRVQINNFKRNQEKFLDQIDYYRKDYEKLNEKLEKSCTDVNAIICGKN